MPLAERSDSDTGGHIMKSFDYEAVTYDGAVYCVDCLPDGVNVNDDEVSPIFADSEWDTAPVCDVCGTVHDYVTVLESDDDDSPGDEDVTADDPAGPFFYLGKQIASNRAE